MAPRQKLSYVDDAVSVGRRLRAAREQAGISQRALSFPGCTAAYISRIENGERIPSLQLLREFAARLGVGEQYLAYGRDDAPASHASPTEARVAIRMGDFETARALANAGLDAARSAVEQAAAFSCSASWRWPGDLTAARAALERAAALDPLIEDRDPRTAEALGRTYGLALEHATAAAVFERNRDRAIAKQDPINEVRFASLLANALIDSGNFSAAEEALSGAIRASEALGDPLAAAGLFWAQSRVHAQHQDAAAAARSAERALQLLDASDRQYDTARLHQMLAHIELDRGNNERAAELLERAAPTIAASGRRFEIAGFQIEQARALLRANRREEAAAIALEAAAGLTGQRALDAGRSSVVLAAVFVELGEEERAIELYELAIEQLEATPNRYLVDAFSKLAELHEKRGDQDAMIETLKRGMSIQRQADRQLTER